MRKLLRPRGFTARRRCWSGILPSVAALEGGKGKGRNRKIKRQREDMEDEQEGKDRLVRQKKSEGMEEGGVRMRRNKKKVG